ncbi:hypothetical protein ACFW93_34640 [Streptomyces canus]|uniref:hypothetical protein n=1 Tax=Streptomyces canus TaxID=58343 RepID=UPI003697B727
MHQTRYLNAQEATVYAVAWDGEKVVPVGLYPGLAQVVVQIALRRPDPQTRALWEMFSDLMDLDDARRYVAGMDVRYDLGDDHRLVGTLCPDMKLTLDGPTPTSSPR